MARFRDRLGLASSGPFFHVFCGLSCSEQCPGPILMGKRCPRACQRFPPASSPRRGQQQHSRPLAPGCCSQAEKSVSLLLLESFIFIFIFFRVFVCFLFCFFVLLFVLFFLRRLPLSAHSGCCGRGGCRRFSPTDLGVECQSAIYILSTFFHFSGFSLPHL